MSRNRIFANIKSRLTPKLATRPPIDRFNQLGTSRGSSGIGRLVGGESERGTSML
jgi:hypothetical protein